MTEPRTVTLLTEDFGPVTLPEPAWCIGHDDHTPGYRADILHVGPDVPLRWAGVVLADASLVQSPFSEKRQPRRIGVSSSLLGQTVGPADLLKLADRLTRHAADLRRLSAQLKRLRAEETR
ncbi:hypothetical protein ACN6K4_003332 [Streptomyces hayashii]|uniref:DUF6907 domain-containing protein n=1 Tax=Streptomyces hayashii TaxID=2839966 RepID=UPI00403C810A